MLSVTTTTLQTRGARVASGTEEAMEGANSGDAARGDLYQVSLVDTPGRVDYGSEVDAALSLVDGALAVVDCVDGVGLQTERVLRSLVLRGIRPVLFINKLDVAMATEGWDAETIMEACVDIVTTVNATICRESSACEWHVWPGDGSVVFGSASGGWGFTVKQFASRMPSSLGLERDELHACMWDDCSRVAADSGTSSGVKTQYRGFVEHVLRPVLKISRLCQSVDQIPCEPRIAAFGVNVSAGECNDMLDGEYFQKIMRRLFPIRESVVDMLFVTCPPHSKPSLATMHPARTT